MKKNCIHKWLTTGGGHIGAKKSTTFARCLHCKQKRQWHFLQQLVDNK